MERENDNPREIWAYFSVACQDSTKQANPVLDGQSKPLSDSLREIKSEDLQNKFLSLAPLDGCQKRGGGGGRRREETKKVAKEEIGD